MNLNEARKILEVSDKASFIEIRSNFRRLARKYHPDVQLDRDSSRFLQVSTAYLVLQGKQLDIEIDKNTHDDISFALNLKAEIDGYFDDILKEFLLFTKAIKARSRDYFRKKILQTSTTSELRSTLEISISNFLTDTTTEIRAFMEEIDRRTRISDDFLFSLFHDMYAARRKYWLINLYRNPVVIFEGIGQIVLALLRWLPEIFSAYPLLLRIVGVWWLPFLLLLPGVVILFIQYLRLNPRKQFLPPNLSIGGIQLMISEAAKQLPATRLQWGFGGAFFGLIVGSIILPGVGTLIGGALGSALTIFGKEFKKTRQKVYDDLMTEFNLGIEQLEDRVSIWVKQSKSDLHRAAVDSFMKNCRKIYGFINGRVLPTRLLLKK